MRHCLYNNEYIVRALIKVNVIYNLSYSLVFTNKRSTKGINSLSFSERKLIIIPDDIKDVLIGILLGDAHIVKRYSRGNSRLVYAQKYITHKA